MTGRAAPAGRRREPDLLRPVLFLVRHRPASHLPHLLAPFLAFPLALTGCASARGAARPPVPAAIVELRRAVDSMVADPIFRSAQWGILVVDPSSGDTLVSRNAGKLFIPASNQKLLTGSVALHLLGPDYRFRTTFSMSAAIGGGVMAGDLVVTGDGDPTLSDHMAGDAMIPFRAIADSLATRGVTRIAGSLARGGGAFTDATLGYGWSWDDLDFAYAAGVDELYFNEGFSRIRVVGGHDVGDPVLVTTAPARTFPRVTVRARTALPDSGSGGRNRIGVRHDSTDAANVIVEGELAPGDSVVVARAHRDQGRAYLEALREALVDRGITIDGGISSTRRPSTIVAAEAAFPPDGREPASYPLFSVVSAPLRDILPAFEKPSQNQIGEILLKTLGRSRTGVGSADSGARVVRDQVLAWGAAADGFVVRDGSGLSRQDVVTPETIVRVLAGIRADTAFRVFYDALPVAGVDGTIARRMRGTAAQGNVRAKTGTLDMARSLSGYVTTADGRLLLFSVLANNWTVPVREVDRVQDALAVRLAQLRLGGR